MPFLIRLISLIVPTAARARWREEWLAEIEHGGRRMITGALPDAWAMRRLARETRRRINRPGLFHALDQDVRYALRTLRTGKSFSVAVIGSLAIGIAATTTAFALVNATFLLPFPGVHEQDELVRVNGSVAFAGASLLLLITMIAACLAPATRAARLNPVDTLRTE